MVSDLRSLGVVGAKVLDFSSKCRIIFLAQGPVNKVSILRTLNEQKFVLGGNSGMVLSYWTSMEGMGVDCATMAVSGEEFRKSGMEVVRDEGGDYIFFAIWNDKKVAGASTIEVVLPSGAWVDSWLRTVGTRSTSFYVSVHGFGL